MDASVVTTTAPWSDMQKLVLSYSTCEVPALDTFLSMDDVDPAAMSIINEIATLFTCQQPTSALVRRRAGEGRRPFCKTIPAGCTLNDDVTPDQFAQTTNDIETGKIQQTLSGKQHVCNNDAELHRPISLPTSATRSRRPRAISTTRTAAGLIPGASSSAPPPRFTEATLGSSVFV